jgi:hypothetical protein
MNKLNALSKLANAYHYVLAGNGDGETAAVLEDKFGYIRRSLRIEDLAPQAKCTEGFNGRMPTQF